MREIRLRNPEAPLPKREVRFPKSKASLPKSKARLREPRGAASEVQARRRFPVNSECFALRQASRHNCRTSTFTHKREKSCRMFTSKSKASPAKARHPNLIGSVRRPNPFEQLTPLWRIMGLSGRQRERYNCSVIRGNQMNFGIPSSRGFSDALTTVFLMPLSHRDEL
jgi:hypothetical protein